MQDAPSIREMKAERGPYSVSATFALTNKPVNALWEWSRVPEVLVRAEAHLPSTSVISFTLGARAPPRRMINAAVACWRIPG